MLFLILTKFHDFRLQQPQQQTWKAKDTAIIFEVGQEELNITLALPAGGPGMHLSSVFPNSGLGPGRAELAKHLTNVKKMLAFGHPLHLATLTFKGLGLYAARRHVLKLPEALNHTQSSGNDGTTTDALPPSTNAAKIFSARSACVNPIIGKSRIQPSFFYHENKCR